MTSHRNLRCPCLWVGGVFSDHPPTPTAATTHTPACCVHRTCWRGCGSSDGRKWSMAKGKAPLGCWHRMWLPECQKQEVSPSSVCPQSGWFCFYRKSSSGPAAEDARYDSPVGRPSGPWWPHSTVARGPASMLCSLETSGASVV